MFLLACACARCFRVVDCKSLVSAVLKTAGQPEQSRFPMGRGTQEASRCWFCRHDFVPGFNRTSSSPCYDTPDRSETCLSFPGIHLQKLKKSSIVGQDTNTRAATRPAQDANASPLPAKPRPNTQLIKKLPVACLPCAFPLLPIHPSILTQSIPWLSLLSALYSKGKKSQLTKENAAKQPPLPA